MKKIYLLALGVVFALTASAQARIYAVPTRPFTRDEISPIATRRQEMPSQNVSAMRVELLNENFETVAGPYPAALPSGWSTNSTTDANNAAVDAFKIHTSTTANGGGYWPVPETGTNNKFAGANDDNDPCDCDNLDSYLQTPVLDFSSSSNVAVQFDIFHDKGFGGGDAQLQVSTDGGTTFTLIPFSSTSDVLPVDGDYWQTLVIPVFDLSGQASVIFRFQWSDAGSWASGFAVDNIVVGELQANNLRADKAVYGDWNQVLINDDFSAGVWHYTQIPLAQVDQVRVTSVISNNGVFDQANANISVALLQDGTPVSGSPFVSTMPSASLVSLDKDTLSVLSGWVPSSVGTISAVVTTFSDSTEVSPADNIATCSMEITTNTYARDANAAQAFFNPEVSFEFGNLFEFHQNDDVAGVWVAIGRQLDANGNDLTEGATYLARVYEWTGIDAATGDPLIGDPIYETIEMTATTDQYNFAGDANFTFLPFVGGAQPFEAGKTYLVNFASAGDVRIALSGGNEWASSWRFDDTGWAGSGSIPMVRLNTDETANVAENNSESTLKLSQNVPNPAIDMTTIGYNLVSNERVQVIVRDITGRIVMQQNEGLRPVGYNTARLNVEQLGAGVYTYTVIAGANTMTKQMVVR